MLHIHYLVWKLIHQNLVITVLSNYKPQQHYPQNKNLSNYPIFLCSKYNQDINDRRQFLMIPYAKNIYYCFPSKITLSTMFIMSFLLLCTFSWGRPAKPWAQGSPWSDTLNLWRHRWKGPSDPSVGEAPGIGNASHPHRLVVIRVSPWAMNSLWCWDFRMLKNTSIGGVS